jgi:predicted DNA-binding antitoxin AbrB/MazE fold protein
MTSTIEAVYENGELKPAQPLPLMEHERIKVTVQDAGIWVAEAAGMIRWTGDFEDLRRFVEDDEFGIRAAR